MDLLLKSILFLARAPSEIESMFVRTSFGLPFFFDPVAEVSETDELDGICASANPLFLLDQRRECDELLSSLSD